MLVNTLTRSACIFDVKWLINARNINQQRITSLKYPSGLQRSDVTCTAAALICCGDTGLPTNSTVCKSCLNCGASDRTAQPPFHQLILFSNFSVESFIHSRRMQFHCYELTPARVTGCAVWHSQHTIPTAKRVRDKCTRHGRTSSYTRRRRTTHP